MEALIAQHPLASWTLVMALGAAMHWLKKWYYGEAPGSPLEYWLLDKTPNSLGALGGMAAAFFGVWGTGALEGSTPQLLLASGWTAGYSIDSLINRSTIQP